MLLEFECTAVYFANKLSCFCFVDEKIVRNFYVLLLFCFSFSFTSNKLQEMSSQFAGSETANKPIDGSHFLKAIQTFSGHTFSD